MSNSAKPSPRILYIIGQLARGGAEQQFYYLLKYLRPNAHVISLRSDDYWAEPIRELGIEVTELKRRGRADISRLLKIVQVIRQYKPDIIHIFTDNTYGLYGRLAAILTGHRRVIVGERTHPTYDPSWYILLRKLLLNRFVSYVVANSQATQDFLVTQMNLPPHKAKFIPNGLEIDRIIKESDEGVNPLPSNWQDKIIVTMVGHISRPKAPDIFVRVAKQVTDQCPDVRFVLVGDGELRTSVETLSTEFGLQDKLLFAGHQNDVVRWLAASNIFLMTSAFEGMPNALMEAMAVGLPCVVTNAGACCELVIDGETGYVASVGDKQGLADFVLRLVGNPSLRQQLGEQGRNRIQSYNVGQMVGKYQELYRNLTLTEK